MNAVTPEQTTRPFGNALASSQSGKEPTFPTLPVRAQCLIETSRAKF